MKIDNSEQGFTLIELMLVVAIIGILAAVALPAYQEYTGRARRAERFLLVEPARQAVSAFYDRWGRFPKSNAEAGLPVPESFRGDLVKSVEVREGIILLILKTDKTNSDASTDVCLATYRPVVHKQNPTSTLRWVRDPDPAPEGFDFDDKAKDIRSFSVVKLCPVK